MRKLASIQKIKKISPIEGADAIEKVSILGWNCVAKKGEFQADDLCIYFEIDSLLPELPVFEFLRKSSWNNKLGKFRLKSAKLRGVLSQGLALPVTSFPEIPGEHLEEGTDVTGLLNIEKYEPEIPAQLAGDVRAFNWPISKTDEERVQSNPDFVKEISGKPYYITIKLDGTSSSFILTKGDTGELEFHVCGRNYSLKNTKGQSFWNLAEKYRLEEQLKAYYEQTGRLISLQGETVGPGIQKNRLGLKQTDVYIFNVVDTVSREKLPLEESVELTQKMGVKFVPLLEEGESFAYSADDLLKKAEGLYNEHFDTAAEGKQREGIVIRSKDQKISFKAINNKFLLKGGD